MHHGNAFRFILILETAGENMDAGGTRSSSMFIRCPQAGWRPLQLQILCEARTSTALSFSAVALFKDSGRVHTRGDPLPTDGLRGRQG